MQPYLMIDNKRYLIVEDEYKVGKQKGEAFAIFSEGVGSWLLVGHVMLIKDPKKKDDTVWAYRIYGHGYHVSGKTVNGAIKAMVKEWTDERRRK